MGYRLDPLSQQERVKNPLLWQFWPPCGLQFRAYPDLSDSFSRNEAGGAENPGPVPALVERLPVGVVVVVGRVLRDLGRPCTVRPHLPDLQVPGAVRTKG